MDKVEIDQRFRFFQTLSSLSSYNKKLDQILRISNADLASTKTIVVVANIVQILPNQPFEKRYEISKNTPNIHSKVKSPKGLDYLASIYKMRNTNDKRALITKT